MSPYSFLCNHSKSCKFLFYWYQELQKLSILVHSPNGFAFLVSITNRLLISYFCEVIWFWNQIIFSLISCNKLNITMFSNVLHSCTKVNIVHQFEKIFTKIICCIFAEFISPRIFPSTIPWLIACPSFLI